MLVGALLTTQVIARVIAVTGIFMTPTSWVWVLLIWVYALAWFIFNDQIKKLAYRIFIPEKMDVMSAE